MGERKCNYGMVNMSFYRELCINKIIVHDVSRRDGPIELHWSKRVHVGYFSDKYGWNE